jgi:hypothetical protein
VVRVKPRLRSAQPYLSLFASFCFDPCQSCGQLRVTILHRPGDGGRVTRPASPSTRKSNDCDTRPARRHKKRPPSRPDGRYSETIVQQSYRPTPRVARSVLMLPSAAMIRRSDHPSSNASSSKETCRMRRDRFRALSTGSRRAAAGHLIGDPVHIPAASLASSGADLDALEG